MKMKALEKQGARNKERQQIVKSAEKKQINNKYEILHENNINI